MRPLLYYCYDAYCGWCYGFSPVMKKIMIAYKDQLDIEVLSGGMMIGETVQPIERIAPYIQSAYKRVEDTTGIQFGGDFLWHINNPDKSDWVMNSEKPAIALCIFKALLPGQQLDFAADLQYALNYEGRDLDDDEAYRHLLEKYGINEKDFYTKLHSNAYKEKACYEFALCKELQADSFPQLLLHPGDNKLYLLAKGYTTFEDLQNKIDNVLQKAVNDKE